MAAVARPGRPVERGREDVVSETDLLWLPLLGASGMNSGLPDHL